jgi:hypothetical protein
MLNRTFSALLLASLLSSGRVQADDNLWLGARAGTLGLGLEMTWQALPYLDFRAGINRYDYDDTRSEAGVDYNATLGLDSLYATANLRMPLSPFRITGGVFANNNSLVLIGQSNGPVNIGGVDYSASDVGVLRGHTAFEKSAPYLGLGFDFRVLDSVALNLDLGVLWQGDPTVGLSADGLLASDPVFQARLESERTELEAVMRDFRAYPAVSLGLSFSF